MSNKIKMIIDTDPGIDDAMAIFYAIAAPEIDLVGLTTVFGNVTTQTATRNALRLVEMAGLEMPVAAGAIVPHSIPEIEPSHWVHGAEGFGNIPVEIPSGSASTECAAEFLVRMAREHKGELVVCPIGPLTNIAKAIQLDPEFTTNCKQIVTMGGSLRAGGNITPYAEANTNHDPHAAKEVFAGAGNQIIVGLDVTTKILCTRSDFTKIADASPKFGGFLKQASEFYIDFYKQVGFGDCCCLHDPAAIIAATHPHYFEMSESPINVILDGEQMGRTCEDANYDVQPINWCSDVDIEAVKSLWMQRIMTLA